jgi:hypothetical protein
MYQAMFFTLNIEIALFLHVTIVIRIPPGNRSKEQQIIVWCNMFYNLKLTILCQITLFSQSVIKH